MKATNNCKRSCAAPYLKVGVQRRSDAVRHSRGLPGGRSATNDCPCMHPRGSSAILWLLQFCNKYFELQKTLGTATPTRTTCCRHLQVRTRQQVRIMQPHAKSMSTHGFTQAWTHRHFPSLNTFSFGVVPIWLVMHVTLPSQIVLLQFQTNTIKNAVTCTQTRVAGTQ